ncbi:hypothetical protein QFZ82_000876 [Streptomyces sp. V4I23]|uniref:hypothetical protein n=1 Tax=Streptomyces sp. V4I23 TaxID=3042282 RepID=UPI0027827E67|nr:hypothetical protein [Streptomyces sp. V4I23]MDQ1006391.1 hypothetical protein [Streptomyces sp. V4I23]
MLLGQSLQWLTDGREKYAWMSRDWHEQLFDLTEDPREVHDLSADPAAAGRLAVWRERLAAAPAGRPEGFVSSGKLVAGRRVDPVLPGLRDAVTA